MDTANNNNIIWYKTSEAEPPAKTQVWVCETWGDGKVRKSIRLDSWDPITKSWKNRGNDLENIYWTYPIYPEIR